MRRTQHDTHHWTRNHTLPPAFPWRARHCSARVLLALASRMGAGVAGVAADQRRSSMTAECWLSFCHRRLGAAGGKGRAKNFTRGYEQFPSCHVTRKTKHKHCLGNESVNRFPMTNKWSSFQQALELRGISGVFLLPLSFFKKEETNQDIQSVSFGCTCIERPLHSLRDFGRLLSSRLWGTL